MDILPLFSEKSKLFSSILGDVKYVILKIKLIQAVALDGVWVMSEAGVLTSGRAVSTLDDHHIKRTLYDHQVLLVAPLSPSARSILDLFHMVIPTHLKNDLTNSRGIDVCLSTVHLLSSWKFSFVVCALSERW